MTIENDNTGDEYTHDGDNLHSDTHQDPSIREDQERDDRELDASDTAPEIEKAKKNGYLTKEEWTAQGKDPSKYKTPEQFNKFGEAYPEIQPVIESFKKKLDARDKEIESLIEYQKRTEARAAIIARQQLEIELQQARELNDINSVERLTRSRTQLEYEDTQAQVRAAQNEQEAVSSAFIERNRHWFNVDNEMTEAARAKVNEIVAYSQRSNLPVTFQQVAESVEAYMHIRYPDRAKAPEARSAPPMSVGSSSSNKSAAVTDGHSKTFSKLDPSYKTMYAAIKRSVERVKGKDGKPRHTYTERDFITKLQKDGEI